MNKSKLALTLLAVATGLPRLLDKPLRPEAVNGWLCRGVTCLAPVSSLEELRSACKEAGLR